MDGWREGGILHSAGLGTVTQEASSQDSPKHKSFTSSFHPSLSPPPPRSITDYIHSLAVDQRERDPGMCAARGCACARLRVCVTRANRG